MLYAKKQKTIGQFYNIYKTELINGILHQERICSFYNWEEVEDFFKGYALLNNKKVERQVFVSGKIILSIKE
nr:MAG: hypothetical protein [Microvirus sp.]